MSDTQKTEWPTLVLLVATYAIWGIATVWVAAWSLPLAILLTTLAGAQHASLQHEILHGHPTRWVWVNEALVFPALTLCVPYIRFRDSHLKHHQDSNLTDPYDDPESNYQDPKVWARLSGASRAILRLNNTLAGRMVIGPIVTQVMFMHCDWRSIRQGDRAILMGWVWHIPAVALVVWWVLAVSNMPAWAFLAAVYLAISILKIRTYLEHRAHERSRGRTVIVEDRGPLSLIFLNNNFHVVHHVHPKVPWYQLPGLYFHDPVRYLKRNDGYRYRSYAEVFKKYLFKAKDPVPHPLWHK